VPTVTYATRKAHFTDGFFPDRFYPVGKTDEFCNHFTNSQFSNHFKKQWKNNWNLIKTPTIWQTEIKSVGN